MKLGIIGMGVVGGTTAQVLGRVHEIYPYDRFKEPYNQPENLEALAVNSDCAFLCVPTPMKPSGEMDYSAVHNSLADLSKQVRQKRPPQDLLVVVRSTAVSGTTEELAWKYPFRFAFNPEFLTEKNALRDMENTDRVVIGVNDERSKQQVLDVYKPLFPNARYVLTNTRTAEMIKYAANVMLASQIALANEVYGVCQAVGVDYNQVKDAVLLDPRIGRNISVPGPDGDFGFGGKCFPKDLKALIYRAREHMYDPYLLQEVWRLNERVRQNKDWLNIPGATSGNGFGNSM